MTDLLAQIITWINVPVNAAGAFLLRPVGSLPGWLSNTIISAVAGVILLMLFKLTSNQQAIGRVRDGIKANLLALKLYKDSILVTFQSQGRLFKSAFQLLFYAIVPMLVMIVPVSLLLGQMGMWYQVRPLLPGEEAVVVMQLDDKVDSAWPKVSIESTPAAEVIAGPVRVSGKRQIYWKIRASQEGYHRLIFKVDSQQVEKQLAISEGFMRVSAKKPGWKFSEILMYSAEKPFSPDSLIRSISIDYPERLSKTSGTDWWLIYFFIASMAFAFIFKPILKVKI